jgi:hypothetical protein
LLVPPYVSGAELANLEMFLILTNILKDFSFRIPSGREKG